MCVLFVVLLIIHLCGNVCLVTGYFAKVFRVHLFKFSLKNFIFCVAIIRNDCVISVQIIQKFLKSCERNFPKIMFLRDIQTHEVSQHDSTAGGRSDYLITQTKYFETGHKFPQLESALFNHIANSGIAYLRAGNANKLRSIFAA